MLNTTLFLNGTILKTQLHNLPFWLQQFPYSSPLIYLYYTSSLTLPQTPGPWSIYILLFFQPSSYQGPLSAQP